MTLGEKIRKVARTAWIILLGLVGYVVFGPWMPQTGTGFLVWACLLFGMIFVGLIILIITGEYKSSPDDDPERTNR